MLVLAKTLLLFVLTALAEITGCFLPYVWLRKGGSPWLLLPAAASLAVFAWLLTLHPAASGPGLCSPMAACTWSRPWPWLPPGGQSAPVQYGYAGRRGGPWQAC